MAVIRTIRFTVDPAAAETMLERRRKLLDAVRAAYNGPSAARLVRVDDETWVDAWRWDESETLQDALAGAPGLPETAAAFELTRVVGSEDGDLVDEDVWAR